MKTTILGAIASVAVTVVAVVAVVEVVNKMEDHSDDNIIEEDRKKTLKEKLQDFKEKESKKVTVFFTWVKQNPMMAVTIFSLILGFMTETRRMGDRISDAAARSKQRRTVYCNDIQSYVTLKHELNYRENKELRDRMSSGETKFQALDSMGLLR